MGKSKKESSDELLALARTVVERARAGAEVAEVTVGSSWDLSARVRLGQPELVEEAGQRGLSLRVIKNGRLAMTSTSDLTEAGLARCVADALELADLSEVDPNVGPADPSLLSHPPFPDLDLFDESVDAIDADAAIERARRCERYALDFDSRIRLSEGATFSRTSSTRAMVLSGGFEGTLTGSYAALSVAPVVEDSGGKKRRGSYWTAHRHLSTLESEQAVGEEAARRTLAKLGAKKVDTCEAPVIFDADAARSIIGTFAGCIVGGALWRKSSYLLGRLGTAVASPVVTLVDDPLIPRGPGSRPFDGEGLPSRKNIVVQAGQLESYLLDCYAARKLDSQPTGSASRGGGSIGASTTNFVMQAGDRRKGAPVLAFHDAVNGIRHRAGDVAGRFEHADERGCITTVEVTVPAD